MFSSSRKKIVISIMCVLILLLTAVLTAVYGSSYYSVRKQNSEMLERYVGLYSLESLPGSQLPQFPADEETGSGPAEEPPNGIPAEGDPPDAGDFFLLSSFCSEAIAPDGEVLAIDAGRNGLYTQDEVRKLADEILSQNKSSGQIDYLLYRVEDKGDYILVAFMDTTLTEDSMSKVLMNTLLAGSVSVILLFFAAIYLAKIIIKPLEDNDRKQKQFISDAGHELKTPISIISANSELLTKEIGDNEWLSNIQYENERMGSLVTDMLALSRAEGSAWQPEQVDLSRIVVQEVLPFESVAFEKGLSLNCDVEQNIMVKGNSRQLCQLVSILTDNAISHGDGGSVDIELVREHKNAVLRVKNKGDEIPENIRKRLFDRFYRMDEARGDNGSHYGLGLSIAKAITEAHKGGIEVEYSDGMIIFSVAIPVDN